MIVDRTSYEMLVFKCWFFSVGQKRAGGLPTGAESVSQFCSNKVVKVLDAIINRNKLGAWTLCNCQKLLDSSGLVPVSVASSRPFAPFSKGPLSHPADLTLSGSYLPTSPIVNFLVAGCWSKPLTMINLMGRGKLGTFQTRNLCSLLKSPFSTVVSREWAASWVLCSVLFKVKSKHVGG